MTVERKLKQIARWRDDIQAMSVPILSTKSIVCGVIAYISRTLMET